jgi:ubiquinone/menaquinone biosynthesis C-methylase UbiE
VKAHPVFARLWDSIVKLGGRPERAHREELIGRARGRVLEVGAGTGLNFKLYGGQARVVAVEPEPTMAGRARDRARSAVAEVRVLRGSGEALPFADGSFDTAICCYVLCTIPDARRAIEEIRRVLVPGGQVLLYEHVRSSRPFGARWQDRATPLWRFFGAGCHPNRDTVGALREGGFQVDVRRFDLGPPSPVRPHVLGAAHLP